MDKDVEILLQNAIHDLCLAVHLWMIGGAYPELGSIEVEKFLLEFANKQRILIWKQASWEAMVLTNHVKK